MGYCIFCDNTANSKEDAWPQWLVSELKYVDVGTMVAQRGQQESQTWRTNKKRKIEIKTVCKTCNSGWMSDLENLVKPVIQRILTDNTVNLDKRMQTNLAIWACKTAMIFDGLRLKSPSFFTDLERRHFRETFTLPTHTFIWIAKSVDFQGLFCSAIDLTGIVITEDEKIKASVTTLGFGSVAIQVLNGKFSKPFDKSATICAKLRPGPWNQVCIPIWPIEIESIIWPNEIGLGGEIGLDEFSQRWNPTV